MDIAETAKQPTTAATGDPVVVGLDGGYVRNRHRADGRRFEVVAGKVTYTDSSYWVVRGKVRAGPGHHVAD